jgi:hypothetical protein
MCDPDLRQRIEEAVEEIERLKANCPPLPEDWELVLELGKDKKTGEDICSYYFVRLSTRCLFWLQDFNLDTILLDLCGVTETTHIRKFDPTPSVRKAKRMNRPGIASSVLVSGRRIPATTSWLITLRAHWEMFPHNREVPESLVQELTGMLLHAGVGTLGPRLNVM